MPASTPQSHTFLGTITAVGGIPRNTDPDLMAKLGAHRPLLPRFVFVEIEQDGLCPGREASPTALARKDPGTGPLDTPHNRHGPGRGDRRGFQIPS